MCVSLCPGKKLGKCYKNSFTEKNFKGVVMPNYEIRSVVSQKQQFKLFILYANNRRSLCQGKNPGKCHTLGFRKKFKGLERTNNGCI